MVVMFEVEIFWLVMLCGVVGYHCFRIPFSLHLEDESSMAL